MWNVQGFIQWVIVCIKVEGVNVMGKFVTCEINDLVVWSC